VTVTGRTVTGAVRWTHDAAMRAAGTVDDAELSASMGPTAPPISFHLWHMARWADRLAAHLRRELGQPGRADEVWAADGWAERFGFSDRPLGFGDTGMGLDDDGWNSLPAPGRDVLLGYVEAAFHDANEAIKPAGAEVEHPCIDLYGRPGTISDVLVAHLAHVSRHLGMIEALIGVHGRPGSTSV
jgi:hypothetical protein